MALHPPRRNPRRSLRARWDLAPEIPPSRSNWPDAVACGNETSAHGKAMSERVSAAEFKIGEGRISGWISVSLGALSVLGVLCFHFPDYLTTPQLRQVYTADQMRYLLVGGMIFSAAFGLVTFALNRHKLMGAIGITLTLLALWGGGASAQVGPRY